MMKTAMNPNTVWDGAEPKGDWSNPAPVAGEFEQIIAVQPNIHPHR